MAGTKSREKVEEKNNLKLEPCIIFSLFLHKLINLQKWSEGNLVVYGTDSSNVVFLLRTLKMPPPWT